MQRSFLGLGLYFGYSQSLGRLGYRYSRPWHPYALQDRCVRWRFSVLKLFDVQTSKYANVRILKLLSIKCLNG